MYGRVRNRNGAINRRGLDEIANNNDERSTDFYLESDLLFTNRKYVHSNTHKYVYEI